MNDLLRKEKDHLKQVLRGTEERLHKLRAVKRHRTNVKFRSFAAHLRGFHSPNPL